MYEIPLSLQEMFGDRGRLASQVALRSILNTKMVEGTLIRDYMITFFNEMKILEVEINGRTQVDMILKAFWILLGNSRSIIL